MNEFVDPRAAPAPRERRPALRPTAQEEILEDLYLLCREGRVYEVEDWIRSGRPLQLSESALNGRRKFISALNIAIKQGNHALVLLLLCNGYDANLERECAIDLALDCRRPDIVDLLLTWGANPHEFDRAKLFDTYESSLFERFYALDVDLTVGHAYAEALGFHTSNKPLFGFTKKYQARDPKIRKELNIALAHHAGEGNEKGTLLCLWAGADPHVPVPALRYIDEEDEEDADDLDDDTLGCSAVYSACMGGHAELLERFGPDPARHDYDNLYRVAPNVGVVKLLARDALPTDMTPVIEWQLRFVGWWRGRRESVAVLRHLFECGARWEQASKSEIREIRRFLLDAPDDAFVALIKILGARDHCSREIRVELARTPAMQKRMKKVGFIPFDRNDPDRVWRRRPEGSDEIMEKFGIELPDPKKQPRLPRTVSLGKEVAGSRQLRLNREGLLKLVWEKRFSRLATEWGISSAVLAKECRRLKVPVPPKTLWNKCAAIRRKRPPRLRELPRGQAEEIVIWTPVE